MLVKTLSCMDKCWKQESLDDVFIVHLQQKKGPLCTLIPVFNFMIVIFPLVWKNVP